MGRKIYIPTPGPRAVGTVTTLLVRAIFFTQFLILVLGSYRNTLRHCQ